MVSFSGRAIRTSREEHRKVPWKSRQSPLRIYSFVAFLKTRQTETSGRLLTYSRSEADRFLRKQWLYHREVSQDN